MLHLLLTKPFDKLAPKRTVVHRCLWPQVMLSLWILLLLPPFQLRKGSLGGHQKIIKKYKLVLLTNHVFTNVVKKTKQFYFIHCSCINFFFDIIPQFFSILLDNG